MIRRGALIVLEGCDKCGKTTQAKLLEESLIKHGLSVQFLRFPDRQTIIGKMCNDYLRMTTELEDHAIHLLFTANRWELVPKMIKLLESGTNLINVDLSWCKQMESGLPKPDAVFYLDINDEEASKRGDYGRERYENRNNQIRVAEIYETFKKEKYWNIINANRSVEDIHTDLFRSALKVITDSGDKIISKLWDQEQHDQGDFIEK
ncbi:DgyrCDS521 [Dimorphilus gyrociliatus]|uniref:DgyrCDS521 n=1 Tax=Dimorphilus gyrociliatus TaxID=2664684 RepID=A0A7I8V4P7_9ANNE|nr:DgyrCDS521 [Dimorphilus gyrociliatus]